MVLHYCNTLLANSFIRSRNRMGNQCETSSLNRNQTCWLRVGYRRPYGRYITNGTKIEDCKMTEYHCGPMLAGWLYESTYKRWHKREIPDKIKKGTRIIYLQLMSLYAEEGGAKINDPNHYKSMANVNTLTSKLWMNAWDEPWESRKTKKKTIIGCLWSLCRRKKNLESRKERWKLEKI